MPTSPHALPLVVRLVTVTLAELEMLMPNPPVAPVAVMSVRVAPSTPLRSMAVRLVPWMTMSE